MALEKVKAYFKENNLDHKILEFDESSATVEEAAKALNCNEARIAKTLSFMVNDQPILIVTAGDQKIDNQKYKLEFKTKAKMMNYDELINYVGHEPGGVCPFGIKNNVLVFLDESLKRFKTVFPACGSSNSAIELTIAELEKYSQMVKWIDVSKSK
ncbi:MAG: YbaK/EbsC family protein [Firmicutes bacterium]|nr:YbaK/EbsC family protein [Bacillota bacterium]